MATHTSFYIDLRRGRFSRLAFTPICTPFAFDLQCLFGQFLVFSFSKVLFARRVGKMRLTYCTRKLVSWCFEPSQPQWITSGLNTNFTLSPSHSFHKSSYHKSCFLSQIYILWALNTGTCNQQGNLFYSSGLHRKHVLATANTVS